MNLSRRQFAGLGGAAVAFAVAGRGIAARAGDAPAIQAGSSNSIDARLAPIDPELRPAARRMLEMGMPPISAATLRRAPPDAGAPKVTLLNDVTVAERRVAAQGTLPEVTVYVVNADAAKRRPAILHIHGGGFIVGAAKTELRYLQETARALDCVIVTVEYRLAPETRYTGSTEDTYAGLKWLYAQADELGADRGRIAVMGESAGGGHAAILAIRARDRGEVPLAFQALVYPMLDDRTGSGAPVPPHIATVGWSPPENRFGWQSFLGMEPGGSNVPAAAVPARLQKLAGLPPAFIGVGGVDLFAAEDMAYARRLTLADVPTELLVVPRAFHGFDRVAPDTTLARQFTKAKLNALRRAFGEQVVI